MKLTLMLASLMLLSDFAYAVPKKTVNIYSYISKPPFVVKRKELSGMSYEVVNALNQFSQQYSFRLIYLPKKRALDLINQSGGVLLWTHPQWVNDELELKYSWIKDLVVDQEIYVTQDENLRYEGTHSLYNKHIVGVRGFVYVNLEDSFKQNLITRIDVKNEVTVLEMLLKNRGDVGILSLQNFWFLAQQNPKLQHEIFVLKNHIKPYYRSVLVSKLSYGVKQEIENWMKSDIGSAQWVDIKNKWLHDDL